jgi:hypothetical protein
MIKIIIDFIVEPIVVLTLCLVPFALLGAAVVWGSLYLTSNDGMHPVPPDHDNRWPGYPKRLGDDGYDIRGGNVE